MVAATFLQMCHPRRQRPVFDGHGRSDGTDSGFLAGHKEAQQLDVSIPPAQLVRIPMLVTSRSITAITESAARSQ